MSCDVGEAMKGLENELSLIPDVGGVEIFLYSFVSRLVVFLLNLL